MTGAGESSPDQGQLPPILGRSVKAAPRKGQPEHAQGDGAQS